MRLTIAVLFSFIVASAYAQGPRSGSVTRAVELDRAALMTIRAGQSGLQQEASKVPNAPPVFLTDMRDLAAEKCGKCDYLYRASGSIDFTAIQTDVISEFRRLGLDVGFAGSVAGELLINSTSSPADNGTSYLQVRVIASNHDPVARTFSGTIFVDASQIKLQNNSASLAPENATTARIERLIMQRTSLTLSRQ